MDNKPVQFEEREKKSVDQWAITIYMPILEAISFVMSELERQLEAIN